VLQVYFEHYFQRKIPKLLKAVLVFNALIQYKFDKAYTLNIKPVES